MNKNVVKLLEKLEEDPILLNKVSKAKDLKNLYKKVINIVDGYTINDLKFALQELEIIPQDRESELLYVSGGKINYENIISKISLISYNLDTISN